MITLKRCAEYVCYDCAVRIFGGDDSAWKIADRVERRWKIQGATQSHIRMFQQQFIDFKTQERKRHDFLFPDRLTYLHR